MRNNFIKINSEYSAQGRNHSKSPGLIRIFKKSSILPKLGNDNCIVDYGCGKLRHFDFLKEYASQLYLIDTREQLERSHTERGFPFDYKEYISKNSHGIFCEVISNQDFEKMNIKCDLVFSIAVADIIPLEDFYNIIIDAHNKLKIGSHFILVVPRNDTSILRRCNDLNSYKEGNIFKRGRYFTYMRNYRDPAPLYAKMTQIGFTLIEDLSIFTQICAVFRKSR